MLLEYVIFHLKSAPVNANHEEDAVRISIVVEVGRVMADPFHSKIVALSYPCIFCLNYASLIFKTSQVHERVRFKFNFLYMVLFYLLTSF